MRCKARVGRTALSMRSDDDPDPRCKRRATMDGYCYQHWPAYKAHRSILARILSFAPRDILRR